MTFVIGALLFGVGFAGLSYLFHDIGEDVKRKRKERDTYISRY